MMTRETTAGRRLLLDRLAVLAATFGVLVVVGLGLTFVSSPAWAVTINSGDILVADQAAFGGGGGVIRIDPITGAQTAVSSGGFFVDPSSITIEANGNILVPMPMR